MAAGAASRVSHDVYKLATIAGSIDVRLRELDDGLCAEERAEGAPR
jgi:hypothetical protein